MKEDNLDPLQMFVSPLCSAPSIPLLTTTFTTAVYYSMYNNYTLLEPNISIHIRSKRHFFCRWFSQLPLSVGYVNPLEGNFNFWIKLVAPGLGLALPPIMMSLGMKNRSISMTNNWLETQDSFLGSMGHGRLYLPIYHTNRRNPPFISCKYTSPMDFSGIGTDKKGTFIDASIFFFATKIATSAGNHLIS